MSLDVFFNFLLSGRSSSRYPSLRSFERALCLRLQRACSNLAVRARQFRRAECEERERGRMAGGSMKFSANEKIARLLCMTNLDPTSSGRSSAFLSVSFLDRAASWSGVLLTRGTQKLLALRTECRSILGTRSTLSSSPRLPLSLSRSLFSPFLPLVNDFAFTDLASSPPPHLPVLPARIRIRSGRLSLVSS